MTEKRHRSRLAEHYGISRASVYRLYRMNRQQQMGSGASRPPGTNKKPTGKKDS